MWRDSLLTAVALGAIGAVIVLLVRQRHFIAVLRDRAAREHSLRNAAESLAAGFTRTEVVEQITRSAVAVMRAHGALVLQLVDRPDARSVDIVSASGSVASGRGLTLPLVGGGAEAVLATSPRVIQLQPTDELLAACGDVAGPVFALVIPLHDTVSSCGALLVLSVTDFDGEDVTWAHTFEHMTTLAFEKLRLLQLADERLRRLENVMQGRSRLMRGFSHDVKNPLGAANGYATLLADGIYGGLTVEQQAALERIKHSLGVALSLIDDLHDFVRAEAGQMVLKLESVNVGALVRVIGAQYAGSANARGLGFDVVVPTDVPMAYTDAARVRQIISNLVSNAVKYTKTGNITLSIKGPGNPLENEDGGIQIDVTDTGPGIPLDKQSWIFDDFSRMDDTTEPGAGLGLAISKLLAEALGGSITVKSEVGSGSTFSLRIPAPPESDPESPDTARADAVARRHIEANLDAALDMTFPASDPIAAGVCE